MKRVRVLYTIPELCVGGAERQLLALAKGLDRGRFDPVIAVLRPGGRLEQEAREADIPILETPRRRRFDPGPLVELVSFMDANAIPIVHSFLFLDGFYARLASALVRTPIRVASLRGMDYAPGSPRCYVDRALKGLTTCLVANSQWMRANAVGWSRDRANDSGPMPYWTAKAQTLNCSRSLGWLSFVASDGTVRACLANIRYGSPDM